MELTIDKEFDALCPPLTNEEEQLLEQSLLKDGCTDPIILWANHDDTVLDGSNRYRLCQKHGIKFATKSLTVESRDEAKAWIIRRQTGRRNLSASQRATLAAKLVNSHAGRPNREKVPGLVSAEKAAEEFDVSGKLVKQARKVLEQGAKPLVEAITSGEVPVQAAAAVAELPKDEQKKVVAKGPAAVKAKAKELKAEKAAVKQYNDTFDPPTFQKPKNGSEKKSQFKDSTIDDLYGKLVRAVDDRWQTVGTHGVLHRMCVAKLREFFNAWTDWRKSK